MEMYDKIEDIINKQTKVLVGVLCKRVEVLEKENALTPSLYKSIVKELIYEHARNLKEIIKVNLTVGKIIFKPRDTK